jgi:CubicO group peptidase (beta-lactamase class C family)
MMAIVFAWIVLRKGYGFADREEKIAYTADMVSCIGSVTKQFTGAAILKLEMMGKLRTDDPISKYLPNVPPDKAGITIHHLMTHTAGFGGDMGGSDEEPISRDDLVARVLAAPLASKPGERFEYSNEGFSLGGAIIERVSGQKYEAFLREHLFLPADMTETGYVMPKWPLSKLPVGYGLQGARWGRVYRNGWLAGEPGWFLNANGGIHASLDDLYRWHLALERSKILSPEAVRKFQQGFAPAMGGQEQYGYGWGVSTTRRGTKAITHNGGNGFMFTDFRRYVDEGVVIIAMTNQPVIPATMLAPRDLESLAFGDRPPTTVPAVVEIPRAAREAHAGTYRLPSGGRVSIAIHDDGLVVTSDDPALFAATAGLTAPGGRFADVEAKTRPIVEASAKGDFKPIFDAFNDDRPFDVVRGNQTKIWQQLRAEHGEYTGCEILGTGIANGDPAVVALVKFTRGSAILRYVWGPRRLVGFISDRGGSAAPVVLLPEGADRYVRFDYRQPANTLRLDFAGGRATVTAGKTVLTATR